MYSTKDFFDMKHYYKIVAARKKVGLPVLKTAKDTTHELVGKQLRKASTGAVYNVESAHLHWYEGWYIVLLIEHNRSHAIVPWENVSSLYDKIDRWCAEVHTRYSPVE